MLKVTNSTVYSVDQRAYVALELARYDGDASFSIRTSSGDEIKLEGLTPDAVLTALCSEIRSLSYAERKDRKAMAVEALARIADAVEEAQRKLAPTEA